MFLTLYKLTGPYATVLDSNPDTRVFEVVIIESQMSNRINEKLFIYMIKTCILYILAL